jgi:hypothetical protein
MNKLVLTLVGIAAALFIGDWAFENYTAFQQSRDASEQVSAELQADLPKQQFSYCVAQWPSDRVLRSMCNNQQFTGIRAFYHARGSNQDAGAQLAMLNCFAGSKTQWGRDWAMAGGCASSI